MSRAYQDELAVVFNFVELHGQLRDDYLLDAQESAVRDLREVAHQQVEAEGLVISAYHFDLFFGEDLEPLHTFDQAASCGDELDVRVCERTEDLHVHVLCLADDRLEFRLEDEEHLLDQVQGAFLDHRVETGHRQVVDFVHELEQVYWSERHADGFFFTCILLLHLFEHFQHQRYHVLEGASEEGR